MRFPGLLVVMLSVMMPVVALGQSGTPEADSLRSYELAEIVVGGATREALSPSTIQKVGLAGLVREDAVAVAEVARLIPAAVVQTNSRGETLVYMRSAGERQVALFFDGALLNIPWDNRVDLSLVPVGAVGGMTVAKGVPSVLYGTNVIGGAVNLTSRSLGRDGTHTEANGLLGSHGFGQAGLNHFVTKGRFSFAGSVGFARQDDHALPADADLPFSQPDAERRLNTDRRLFNLFGRAGYQFAGGTQAGLSLFHVDGEKGVAPESHIDPDVDRVRYWRYPMWRNTMLILNGTVPLGPESRLRGAIWGGRFAQDIDQYTSQTYDTLDERQEDEDLTLGTRLTLLQPLGPGHLSIALNALTSAHRQVDTAFSDGTPAASPKRSFRQHLYSFGGEYALPLGPRLQASLGGSLDGIATPDTDDKPARDPQHDLGFTSGLVYQSTDALAFKAAFGRKVRFPTMRELFGEALNRFLVNPGLRPEASLLGEVGVVFQNEHLAGEVTAFVNRTHDTIDQRNVVVDGERKRQRINLDGSRVLGIEVVGTARPLPRTTLEGHLTWMDTRALLEDEPDRPLIERPEWLGTLTLSHAAAWGGTAMVQGVYTGRAFGLGEENNLVALPIALKINARVAYRLYVPRRQLFAEFFVRVDNLTDALAMPQLGLPMPGREVRGGLSLSL